MGEVGNGLNKTSDGDFDMEGKRLINIGKPVDLPDAATLFTVSDVILKAGNALWKEMAAVKEYIGAENIKNSRLTCKIRRLYIETACKGRHQHH